MHSYKPAKSILLCNCFRCGPCKAIAPFLEEMSTKYPNAHFLNVGVDECQETAASYGVTAMPTFVFLRNKTRLALLKGADKAGLEAKIQQFYTDASQDEEVGVKGMVRKLVPFFFFDLMKFEATVPCKKTQLFGT